MINITGVYFNHEFIHICLLSKVYHDGENYYIEESESAQGAWCSCPLLKTNYISLFSSELSTYLQK